MFGLMTPKQPPRMGLLPAVPSGMASSGPISGSCGRVMGAGTGCVFGRAWTYSGTKNNQLRTGADKGNPTV